MKHPEPKRFRDFLNKSRYGITVITIDTAAQDKIVQVAPGNLFLKLTTEVFTSAGPGKGTSAASQIDSYRRYETLEPVVVPGDTASKLPDQGIDTMELYINNIFVNPEIHDIYIKRIGFSLIRVYRSQTQEIATTEGQFLMSQLKWPIETIYSGLRPVFNQKAPTRSGLTVTSGNVNEWRDWHRFTRNVDKVCYNACSSTSALTTGAADPSALTAADFTATDNVQQNVSQCGRLVFPEIKKTLTTVKIQAHGINIYQDFKAEFFSNYQPYTYGGYNIVTPEDEGALMINFCLYPGTYQPSAHINVSRAREFYYIFTSGFTGVADNDDPAAPVTAKAVLVIVAIAINFLLISDGSAVLRYST